MKKAADKERASQGIGLATEHRLPKAFKAKTDDHAGTVEITKENARPLSIAINSFGAVSNLLAIFAPDGRASLEPGHTIKIVDEFNNRSATITANAFIDAATAMNTFVVERGKYLPAAADSEPAPQKMPSRAAAKAKSEAVPEVEASKEEAASKPEAKKSAPPKKGKSTGKPAPAAPVAAEASTAVETTGAKAGAKAKPKPAAKAEATTTQEGWAKDLPTEHVDSEGGFRLDARTLALPKERAKTTSGVSDGSAEHEAFGYAVSEGTKPGGRHLGYVIVEDPKSWIVTGFGDIAPTKHANLNAATIRIRVTNLRHLRGE